MTIVKGLKRIGKCLQFIGSKKTKGLNMMANMGICFICMREIGLGFRGPG
jgi:hypothetical protein